MSRSSACLNSIVLPKTSPLGLTLGLRQTMSNSRPFDAIIRPINSLKPSSFLPVSSTVKACSSLMLSCTSSAIFSFQQPSHARFSSISSPWPVAASMFGLCHQPPLCRNSCAWSCPHVPVFQSCLLGRGEENTVFCRSASERVNHVSCLVSSYRCCRNRRRGWL